MKWLFCKTGLHRWSWVFVNKPRPDWPNEWALQCLECGKDFDHD